MSLLAAAVLLAAAPVPQGTLTVTATRDERPLRDLAGNTAVIAGDDIALVVPTHAADIVGRAAGAWVTRGSTQEHLTAIRSPILTGPGACGAFLFLQDGIPARAPGFCNVNGLFELNIEQARAVEVVRGPGSALYGSNALHGMINVLMPSARDPVHTARLDTGEHGFVRLSAGFGVVDDRLAWRVDANAARDDGWRDGSAYKQQKLNARMALGDAEWSFAATRLRQDTAAFIVGEHAYRDRTVARGNPSPDAYRDADSQRLSVAWETTAGDWAVTLRPYARRAQMAFLQHFIPGEPTETNDHASIGTQLLLRRGTLIVGSDLEYTRGSVEQFQAQPLTTASDFLNATRPQGRHYDFTVDARTAAAFAQMEQPLAGAWRVTGGIRFEHTAYDYANHLAPGNLRDDGTPCAFGGCHYNRPADREDRFDTWTPKLGLSRAFGDAVVGYASLTRGFRAPQVNELYRLQRGQDVADLDHERLDSIEFGARGVIASLQFDVAAFVMDKRAVVFQDADGFAISDGRTRHRGIEVSLAQPLGRQFVLAVDGTVARHTYAFDRIVAGGESIVHGNDVDTAPRHLGSARLTWRPGEHTRVEMEAVRVGSHWVDAANEHRYHGHTLLHLRGAHRVASRWHLGWRLTNLADRRYAERADFAFGDYRYFPGPPRMAFVSLSRTL